MVLPLSCLSDAALGAMNALAVHKLLAILTEAVFVSNNFAYMSVKCKMILHWVIFGQVLHYPLKDVLQDWWHAPLFLVKKNPSFVVELLFDDGWQIFPSPLGRTSLLWRWSFRFSRSSFRRTELVHDISPIIDRTCSFFWPWSRLSFVFSLHLPWQYQYILVSIILHLPGRHVVGGARGGFKGILQAAPWPSGNEYIFSSPISWVVFRRYIWSKFISTALFYVGCPF